MKRLLASVGIALIALFGMTTNASAAELTEQEQQCVDEYNAAVLELIADLDDVTFDQMLYDWDDAWYRYELGQITWDELVAELDAIVDGLFSELQACADAIVIDDLVEPREPAAVPTSVPAGGQLPDTGAGLVAGLVGAGLVGTGGLLLLGRRFLTSS